MKDSRVAPVVEAVSSRARVARSSKKVSPNLLWRSPKFWHPFGMSIPIFDGFGRRALFTFSSLERKPDTTMLADGYSVLTLGAFIDGYLQSRNDDGLMSAAPSRLTSFQLECLAWAPAGQDQRRYRSTSQCQSTCGRFQLQNIRRKLNVVTTYRARGIAIKRNWT